MGTFVRTSTVVTSAPPVTAIAVASLSSSSSSNFRFPIKPNLPLFASLCSSSPPNSFKPLKSQRLPLAAALHMDSIATDLKPEGAGIFPELMTEFMVDMKCEGCVSAVKDKLLTVEGVKSVDVDLSNQVVRVVGSLPVKTMADALEQTGRKARLIGQGNPNDFLISAAVAEFKGPVIFGVVRLAQVNMELARIEATFSGLSPGKHGWSINEFGDLTKGAESTGKVYNPTSTSSEKI